jgi:hypothetical protein
MYLENRSCQLNSGKVASVRRALVPRRVVVQTTRLDAISKANIASKAGKGPRV